MIIHQLYVDRFSQCISQFIKVAHVAYIWTFMESRSRRVSPYIFCTYETFDLVELILSKLATSFGT